MGAEGLHGFLLNRLGDEGLAKGEPVTVAELQKRLLPYHRCREELGFTTKAEYDVALLELLRDRGRLASREPSLVEAVEAELRSPEPGLALLQRFAASEILVRPAVTVSPTVTQQGAEKVVVAEAADRPVEAAAGQPGAAAATAARASAPAAPRAPDARLDIATAPVESTARAAETPLERCRACDLSLPRREGLRFCPYCGTDQSRWPCAACEAEVERGWRYCAMCGKLQPGI